MVDDELGREFLGTGWAFPVAIGADTGLLERASFEEDIRQSIAIILGTAKGERVMRPDFGCGIHDLVFAAISTQVVAQIGTTVREALRDHEARIEVRRVEVGTRHLDLGRLDVVIDYQVRDTNQPGNVVYPFYFEESASR
ncbi:GPW/gp25 family protein [Geodermatophilus sp. SYSU D00766]